VELNYWNPQPELLEWSKQHGILLEAYSPLGSTDMVSRTLKLPVVSLMNRTFQCLIYTYVFLKVKKIAKKLNITPAQVIISWHVQRGTVVLPKSLDAGRISENYQSRQFRV
jgi:diketogulonate reductase-like aldo/keto reductase